MVEAINNASAIEYTILVVVLFFALIGMQALYDDLTKRNRSN